MVNSHEVLQPDAAEQVDCVVIHEAVFQNPQKCFPPGATTTVLEGFVVIQVPTENTGPAVLPSPLLDVVGNYAARARKAQADVSTQNIVVYSPQEITH